MDLFISDNKVHIITEFIKHKPFISFFSEFNIDEIRYYLYELLKCIKTLKDLGIYHRDIKPGNFLFNPKEKKGYIIDFGLSEIDNNHVK